MFSISETHLMPQGFKQSNNWARAGDDPENGHGIVCERKKRNESVAKVIFETEKFVQRKIEAQRHGKKIKRTLSLTSELSIFHYVRLFALESLISGLSRASENGFRLKTEGED